MYDPEYVRDRAFAGTLWIGHRLLDRTHLGMDSSLALWDNVSGSDLAFLDLDTEGFGGRRRPAAPDFDLTALGLSLPASA